MTSRDISTNFSFLELEPMERGELTPAKSIYSLILDFRQVIFMVFFIEEAVVVIM